MIEFNEMLKHSFDKDIFRWIVVFYLQRRYFEMEVILYTIVLIFAISGFKYLLEMNEISEFIWKLKQIYKGGIVRNPCLAIFQNNSSFAKTILTTIPISDDLNLTCVISAPNISDY